MSVRLLEGFIQSILPFPAYAGQSFEYVTPGPVSRLGHEEHQAGCSLGPATFSFPLAEIYYAGDGFDGVGDLAVYPDYLGLSVYGFFGDGQVNGGGASLGLGYTVQRERHSPI